MPRYTLFHPDTEILGQVLLDLEQAVGGHNFAAVLERHGLVDVEPDIWYSAQLWVDVLNDIVEVGSAMSDLVSLGMRQIELVEWPPETDDMALLDVLYMLNDVYCENYRGTDPGSVAVEEVGDGHVKVIVRSFEPDDLWYGNLYSIAQRFLPAGVRCIVSYDATHPRREDGGETTIYHLKW